MSFLINAGRRRWRSGGGGGGVPAFTKADIEALETTAGRTSVASLKVVGVDSFPTGVTESAGLITVASTFSGTLSDWEFRDYAMVWDANSGSITQCVFGEVSGITGGTYPLLVNAGKAITSITRCGFIGKGYEGKGTVINANRTGTDAAPTVGSIGLVEYCSFTRWPGDHIKLLGAVGGQTIRRNYFGPPENLPFNPPTWNAGTTYALGDLVNSGLYTYRSLSNGNLGNATPTNISDNAFWAVVDPHSDALTTVAGVGGIVIEENYFEWTLPPVGYARGINNAYRQSRNTGTSPLIEGLEFRRNVVRHTAGSSLPIALSAEGANVTGAYKLNDNWLDANVAGTYVSPANSGMDEATGNVDIDTGVSVDALIPIRTRVESISAIAISTTSLTVNATIKQRGGTLYYVVTASSTQPSIAQIVAGQDHTGASAAAAGSAVTTTEGAQTFSGITLPTDYAGFVHLAYVRNGYSSSRSSGGFSLAAIDYAVKAAGNTSSLTGPTFPSSTHSLTQRIVFYAQDGTDSSGQLYNNTSNNFLVRIDNRSTARRFSFFMEPGGLTSQYSFAGGAATSSLVYTPGQRVELIVSATQDKLLDEFANPLAAIKCWANGVLIFDASGPSRGTGFFNTGAQSIIPNIVGEIGMRTYQAWYNEWLPSGDVSTLGTPSVDIDGNEVLWNGTGLPSGWAKDGANAFT